jgi:hypothetical protein
MVSGEADSAPEPGQHRGVVSAVVYGPHVPLRDCALAWPYAWPGESGEARVPQCFGTGAGPSGWKADTNGVMFY